MPNKLTINHIMNMIQAHNELCAYAPQAHRMGAYIEIEDDTGCISPLFDESYIFNTKQFWDLLKENYTEDFMESLMGAKFEKCPTTLYLEANIDVFRSSGEIEQYRIIVSIWER